MPTAVFGCQVPEIPTAYPESLRAENDAYGRMSALMAQYPSFFADYASVHLGEIFGRTDTVTKWAITDFFARYLPFAMGVEVEVHRDARTMSMDYRLAVLYAIPRRTAPGENGGVRIVEDLSRAHHPQNYSLPQPATQVQEGPPRRLRLRSAD